MLKLYNTLTRQKEIFEPLKSDYVRQYDCGPTVYWYAHIGNLWRYTMSDLIRRVLEFNGYQVKQVMNITDVGHLTDEDLAADTGEDKIATAARREKKTPVAAHMVWSSVISPARPRPAASCLPATPGRRHPPLRHR